MNHSNTKTDNQPKRMGGIGRQQGLNGPSMGGIAPHGQPNRQAGGVFGKPSTNESLSRQGSGTFMAENFKKTILHRDFVEADGGRTKKRAEIVCYNIPSDKLEEAVLLAPDNPRMWENDSVEHLKYYDDIRERKQIDSPAFCYRMAGSDTVYVTNGGSRRQIAIHLYKKEGIVLDFPVEVVTLSEDEMWIAEQTVHLSNMNRKFSKLEDARRLHRFFSKYSGMSQRGLIAQYKKFTSVSLSNASAKKALAMYPLFCENSLNPVPRAIKDLNSLSEGFLVKLLEYLVGKTIKEMDFNVFNPMTGQQSLSLDKIKALADDVMIDRVDELDGFIRSTGDVGDKAMVRALTNYLSNYGKSEEDNEPESEDKFFVEGKDRVAQAENTSFGVSLGSHYLSENHTKTEMEAIKRVMERNKDKIESFLLSIDEEVQREMKDA